MPYSQIRRIYYSCRANAYNIKKTSLPGTYPGPTRELPGSTARAHPPKDERPTRHLPGSTARAHPPKDERPTWHLPGTYPGALHARVCPRSSGLPGTYPAPTREHCTPASAQGRAAYPAPTREHCTPASAQGRAAYPAPTREHSAQPAAPLERKILPHSKHRASAPLNNFFDFAYPARRPAAVPGKGSVEGSPLQWSSGGASPFRTLYYADVWDSSFRKILYYGKR